MDQENVSRLRLLAKEAQMMMQEFSEKDEQKILNSAFEYFGNFPPIKTLEKILEHYKKIYFEIVRNKMPTLMIENETSAITFDDGTKVELKKGISPKVVDREKMIDWIEEIDMADCVKAELKFPKGERYQELEEYLEENGFSYEKKFDVHYQTLKKIISDRYNNGEGLPPGDAVAVGVYDEVKIV